MKNIASSHDLRGFFFARHAQSTSNQEGVSSGGESNPALTRTGIEQAREIARLLESCGIIPGLIVTPPPKRNLHTARIVSQALDLDIRIETSLMERFLGDWNGQPSTQTSSLLKQGITPPNGESAAKFKERILFSLQSLSRFYDRWPLIIGSRGSSRILLEESEGENQEFLNNGETVLVKVSSALNFRVSKIQ